MAINSWSACRMTGLGDSKILAFISMPNRIPAGFDISQGTGCPQTRCWWLDATRLPILAIPIVVRGTLVPSMKQKHYGGSMLKILIPVDGSENALRAVKHVVMLAQNNTLLICDLLYVGQPFEARVHAYRPHEEVAKMEKEEARNALLAAQALLDGAGIHYVVAVKEGDVAQHIVEHAQQARCTFIVMGMRGMGLVVGPFSMGSVTSKVLHAADVPVTLLK